jgi:TusA-related sulfurtransferase
MTYDNSVDITAAVCPITFVKVKVALEKTDDKKVLYVRLNDGEPIQNIPRSLKDEGHKVVKLENNGDGTYGLYVVKNGL